MFGSLKQSGRRQGLFKPQKGLSRTANRPGTGFRQWAPLMVGVGYGVASFLPGGLSRQDLYWQSPLMFTVFSGLAIAYTCRPVLSKIPWSRESVLLIALLLLGGIGPLGEWRCPGFWRGFGWPHSP